MQANLNQKIEIVIVHHGEIVHIITGFLGGHNAEWKIDRKEFQAFVDSKGNRGWVVGYKNGQSAAQLQGKMTWEEYYDDIRAVEEDVAEFIEAKKIKATTFLIPKS